MSLGVQGENFLCDKITHIQEGVGVERSEPLRKKQRVQERAVVWDPPFFHGDVENKKGGED